MDVIVGAAGSDRDAAQAADDAAEVLPEALPNLRGDRGPAVLGAEDKVVVQTGVGLRHRRGSIDRPLRGLWETGRSSRPGVSPLATVGRRSAAAIRRAHSNWQPRTGDPPNHPSPLRG